MVMGVMMHLPVLSSWCFVPGPALITRLRLPPAMPRLCSAAGSGRGARWCEGRSEAEGQARPWLLQNGEGMHVLGGLADMTGHATSLRRVNGANSTRHLYPKPVLDLAMVVCVRERERERERERDAHARTHTHTHTHTHRSKSTCTWPGRRRSTRKYFTDGSFGIATRAVLPWLRAKSGHLTSCRQTYPGTCAQP